MGEQLFYQYVSSGGSIEGTCYPVLPVLSGVPQGFVLGPLPFLIFIDDAMVQVSRGSSLSLLADDMASYCSICFSVDVSVVHRNMT